MTTHLLEAILLNLKRLPKYAKLSRGKSLPVSLMLVSSEVLSLFTAILFDTKAKYWQKRGVPVFVHEFVPMRETPKFKASMPIPAHDRLPSFSFGKRELKDLISKRDYRGLSLALEKRLAELGQFPDVWCMTRHTLESFLRSSNLSIRHIERAQEVGTRSPEPFCLQNLKAHLLAIGFCALLDKVAFRTQREGLPIVGNDVPSIPPMPENY